MCDAAQRWCGCGSLVEVVVVGRERNAHSTMVVRAVVLEMVAAWVGIATIACWRRLVQQPHVLYS